MKTVAAMSMLSPEPIAARNAFTSEPAATAQRHEPKAEAEIRSETASLPSVPVGARPGVLGVLCSKDIAQPPVQRTMTASVMPMVPAAPSVPSSARETSREASREAARSAPAALPAVAERKPRSSGWIIQVGAFEDRDEAREKIADARSKAGNLLKGAEPYTEIFAKGERRFYRARFAGLKESSAEQACKELQKSNIACFATRN